MNKSQHIYLQKKFSKRNAIFSLIAIHGWKDLEFKLALTLAKHEEPNGKSRNKS